MIYLKNAQQLEAMRKAGALLYDVLGELRTYIRPGISTLELDTIAERLIRKGGAIPTEKGYEGYPASICASVNDEVVHGIPTAETVLQEGDILSVDCTLMLDGWQSDSAFTVGIGQISDADRRLIDVTQQSFFVGARMALNGNHLGDVSAAVQQYNEKHGYGVVRALTGHGIGREMHEDPSVPNYGRAGHGTRLRAGMTLCIEPMITMGDYKVCMLEDGWTIVTEDGSKAAHYEHTIAINERGLPEILTYPGFKWEG